MIAEIKKFTYCYNSFLWSINFNFDCDHVIKNPIEKPE